MRWVALLLLVPLAGCVADARPCDAPADAEASREPYDNGVVLYTLLTADGDDHVVDAWACNEDAVDRHLLNREGECKGSWTWTLQPPGAEAATMGWPSQGHYGDCDFSTLPPGSGTSQRFTLPMADAPPGSEWRIRLQVYTQPEIIEDAGGGPVHAVYTL